MTQRTLQAKAKRYAELSAKAAELEKQMNEIKAELQREMQAAGTERLQAGNFLIRWSRYITYRFDSKSFKADHAGLYEEYARPTESRRFSIAV